MSSDHIKHSYMNTARPNMQFIWRTNNGKVSDGTVDNHRLLCGLTPCLLMACVWRLLLQPVFLACRVSSEVQVFSISAFQLHSEPCREKTPTRSDKKSRCTVTEDG